MINKKCHRCVTVMRFITVAIGVSIIFLSLAWQKRKSFFSRLKTHSCKLKHQVQTPEYYRSFDTFGKGFLVQENVKQFYQHLKQSSNNSFELLASSSSNKVYAAPESNYTCHEHTECAINLIQFINLHKHEIVIHGENENSLKVIQNLDLDAVIHDMIERNVCFKFFDTVYHPTIMHGFHPDIAQCGKFE